MKEKFPPLVQIPIEEIDMEDGFVYWQSLAVAIGRYPISDYINTLSNNARIIYVEYKRLLKEAGYE